MTMIDIGCWERGCACYDSRIADETVEVVRRDWVGLTDEEIDDLHMAVKVRLMGTFDIKDIYRSVEAKLKEKNT